MFTPSKYLTHYFKVHRQLPPRRIERAEIELTLKNNDIAPNEPLVSFGLAFDGCTFDYYGEGKIELSLIKGGGFPFNPNTAFVESDEVECPRSGEDITIFQLTTTDHPVPIAIDYNLGYYEGGELASSSFYMKLEDVAMHAYARRVYEKHQRKYGVLESELQHILGNGKFNNLPHSSDEFVQWYSNENSVIRKDQISVSLFSH